MPQTPDETDDVFLWCDKRHDYCLECTVTKYNLGLKIYRAHEPSGDNSNMY